MGEISRKEKRMNLSNSLGNVIFFENGIEI
jgi:hypothetical protein